MFAVYTRQNFLDRHKQSSISKVDRNQHLTQLC